MPSAEGLLEESERRARCESAAENERGVSYIVCWAHWWNLRAIFFLSVALKEGGMGECRKYFWGGGVFEIWREVGDFFVWFFVGFSDFT